MKIKAEELIRKIQKGELKSGTKIICHMESPKADFDVETWFMGNWFSTSEEGCGDDYDMIIRLCDGRYTYEIIEKDKKIEKISWREKESLAGNLMASEKQEILARRTEKLKSSLNELIDEINNLKENKWNNK